MTPAPDPLIEIFTQALSLGGRERSTYLEQVCGGRRELRQSVEDLLESHERAGAFLEQAVELIAPPAVGEVPGDLVDKYQLIEIIGEGGCGVVFLAKQEQPVRREVALKVVKPGMDTRGVIARFESERQALAMMEHPHIARVLDAGATAAGRPYFVMELVRGEKVTDYCDHHGMSPHARLRLFVKICHAVQHAHQKGIIHRDIKPSNILVSTTGEGEPLPKVIDFGIAKATTDLHLNGQTLFTAFELLVGTPAYMSPEQAALKSGDLDTRTDIYSLGVLLYELLTGSTPFGIRNLFQAGLDEVRRDILGKEPLRPSSRLRLLEASELAEVARKRRSEPARLMRETRGDLEWIVMKALEKDRSRRYPTANALAMDVLHYLASEPVIARPPSTGYQLAKLIARNRGLAASVAVITLILLGGLGVVSILLAREQSARHQAEVEKQTAEKEAAKSKEVSRFLESMFEGVAPAVAMGRDTTILKEILDRTDKEIGVALANQPEVEAELRLALGGAYRQIGDYETGERLLRRVVELQRTASTPDLGKLAIARNWLGVLLLRQDRYGEAEEEFQATTELWQQLNAGESSEAVSTLQNIAMLRWRQHRSEEAEAMMRRVIALRLKSFSPDDDEVLVSLVNLGGVLYSLGKFDEAEQTFRQVLDAETKRYGVDHPNRALTLGNLGSLMLLRKRTAEAKGFFTQAAALHRRFLDPGDARRTESIRRLAYLHHQTGELGDAEALYREAVKEGRKTPDDLNATFMSTLGQLVGLLQGQGRIGDAEDLLVSLLAPEILNSPRCAPLLELQVNFLGRSGSWAKAFGAAKLLHELEPQKQEHLHTMTCLFVAEGKAEEYRSLCSEMLASFRDTTDLLVADRVAKDCLILPGAVPDLAPVALLAEKPLRDGGNSDSQPFFQVCKALSDYRQGRFAEAAAGAEKVGDKIPEAEVIAWALRSMAAHRLGQSESARSLLEKGQSAFQSKLPELENRDLGQNWRDWIIARELLAEARTLLGEPLR